jgi:hypothetical protein
MTAPTTIEASAASQPQPAPAAASEAKAAVPETVHPAATRAEPAPTAAAPVQPQPAQGDLLASPARPAAASDTAPKPAPAPAPHGEAAEHAGDARQGATQP